MATVDHEAAIRATFADLDLWRRRTQVPWQPAEGSELAYDDEDWPWWRLSQLAISGLAAGREHLDAIRQHLVHTGPYSFADATLARTAILGGAQAVWMLAPKDRPTRLERARTMAAEVYHKHGQLLADLSVLGGGDHDDTEHVKQHVAARATELRSLREAAGQRSRFVATQVIEEAVREVLGEPFVLEARIEWRRGSGAAHGLPWSLLGRPSTRQTGEADARGVAAFVAAGGWQSVSNGYLAAYHLLRHGWLLLDRRGSAGSTNEQGPA